MKIIHSSDWHLGSGWRGFDRTEDLFGQVEQICEIVLDHKADVLLVVGDIFERVGRDKLNQVTKRLARSLKRLIDQDVHIVLIPGNHDLREHFAVLKSFLELNTGNSELVHVAEGIEVFEISGVQFICLPYPERELLEKFDEHRKIENLGKEERNRFLSNNLVEIVRYIDQKLIDPTRPAVFATHIQIDGVKPSAESEKELHYLDDISLSAGDLPTNASYIALGHIHQQQMISHSIPCWYSGSYDCMDVGEIKDEKGVLLIEVNSPYSSTVQSIPLKTTRFVDLKICSGEIENKANEFADSRRLYGRVEIDCPMGVDPIAVRRETIQFFRKCEVRLTGEAFKTSSINALNNPHDRRQTIMEYLDERFANDSDLNDLKFLADKLIGEVSDAFTKN